MSTPAAGRRRRAPTSDNVVTVLLQDTLTKGERSLVSDDLNWLVLTMRKAFQRTMRPDLVDAVEEILGRKAIAFMSDNHLDRLRGGGVRAPPRRH